MKISVIFLALAGTIKAWSINGHLLGKLTLPAIWAFTFFVSCPNLNADNLS